MVQFSDPLRRKTYEPKVVIQEHKKDGTIVSDKISQLSLNIRKEMTLNLKQENGSQDQIDVKESGCSVERSTVSYKYLSKSIFCYFGLPIFYVAQKRVTFYI